VPQLSLFEARPTVNVPESYRNWTPPNPPSLDGVKDVILDCETNGLRWWAGDRPIGLAVGFRDGRCMYLPFGHAGGNLDEEAVKRWARQELRGKRIINLNTAFDTLMLYAWGIDLEAQGCTVTDVGHYAALLDDHRDSYSLDNLGKDYLGYGKVEGLDKRRMADYHSRDVAPYADRDALLVNALYDVFWLKLTEEDLHRVRQVEDDCIFATCEMMRNGAPLDEEKLNAWIKRSEQDLLAALWELHKLTGMNINPASRDDLIRLFSHLGIPPPVMNEYEKSPGKICFARDKLARIDHPTIKVVYRARRLASLRSKYLLNYQKQLKLNGNPLRYALHQLPVEDEGGTISGRYSSSGFGTEEGDGVNIQQVAGKKHAHAMKGDEHLAGYDIRELFVPSSGLWDSNDAEQIEYRLFAHYAQPPKVIEAYKNDPHTDFHNVVMGMIREVMATITRERTKDVNFAKLFGARVPRIANMLCVTKKEAQKFINAYDTAFPEAEQLIKKTMNLAETRGYVKTILGRRTRFPTRERLHKAPNGIIQGSAADEAKTKTALLHRERKNTGLKMRFVVHDEINGDVPDLESAKKVDALLNTQILKTRVPLLWKMGTGKNWQEAK
jgi:DNA polymerase I-like protein with 3'-5' exonuclease and polymerase domains